VRTLATTLATALALVMATQAAAAHGGASRIASVARTAANTPPITSARPALVVRPRSPAALRRAKRAAERRARHLRHRRQPRVAAAAPVAGLVATGLRATQSLFGVPPDTTGAIGPQHYVEIVNDAVAVFRRSDLARVRGPVPNETFMRAPAGTFVSDPQMQWDPQSGRWFYLAVAFTVNLSTFQPSGPNYLVYGFSKTDDPSDLGQGWCRYSLASGSTTDGHPLLDDFPKLGHDDQHLIFGSNTFALGGGGEGTFVSARIWSVPKPPAGALAVCPPAATATTFGSEGNPLRTSTGELVTTPIPANTSDSSPVGYVVAARDATLGRQDQIVVWHVSGAADAPTLVRDGDISVGGYRVPRPALQFVFPRIDTLDARLTMAVAHADPDAGGQEAVWTQHTVDPGDGSVAMRWYELLPGSGVARQQGAIAEPLVDVFNGAVSPAADGRSAVAVYNRSGLFLLPQIRARGRTGSMALGVLGPSIGLSSSGSPDYDLGCQRVCRWGDYAGASPDPAATSVVWVASQAIANPGGLLPNWTTTIAAIDAAGA
jgi:hypothetical protein